MHKKRISVDNSKINAWATDPKLKARWPFLAKTIEKVCCGGRKALRPDHESIKSSLVNLSGTDLEEFKTAVGASELVVYLQCSGMPQEFVK